jgi:hypothetical protein
MPLPTAPEARHSPTPARNVHERVGDCAAAPPSSNHSHTTPAHRQVMPKRQFCTVMVPALESCVEAKSAGRISGVQLYVAPMLTVSPGA